MQPATPLRGVTFLMLIRILAITLIAALTSISAAWPIFRITLDPELTDTPQTGRLLIYLIHENANIEPGKNPADGPFWDDPQPIFGIDVTNLMPGAHIDVQDGADHFPVPPSQLPQANYRVQAVLDVRAAHSDWKREPGNLYSEPATFLIGATDGPTLHELKLTNIVPELDHPAVPGVEIFQVRSRILSRFHGHDVYLRAGIIFPQNHDPDRAYPAIYEVPGFGSDHLTAFEHGGIRLTLSPGTPEADLAQNTFHIVLDPESANGHTLFADSANNGPRGTALVTELIPALEARYNLIAKPHARLLRGHSSGGWSTIWLAISYPDTFGAAWSTAPDPVDFRRFQLVNIYEQDNFYVENDEDIPSYRAAGRVKMTIREENLMEHVLGPSATSGQQWASWQAVFGPRQQWGGPVPLYHPLTGEIDHAVAAHFRSYDITQRLRNDNDIALIFRQRIRLVMGEEDNFYLEEAVRLLQRHLDEIHFAHFPEGEHGYIRLIPGHDHYTIKEHQSILDFPRQMLEHLERTINDER